MSKKLAKKLAIRSGDYLEKEELQVLLNQFFDCKETQVSRSISQFLFLWKRLK